MKTAAARAGHRKCRQLGLCQASPWAAGDEHRQWPQSLGKQTEQTSEICAEGKRTLLKLLGPAFLKKGLSGLKLASLSPLSPNQPLTYC